MILSTTPQLEGQPIKQYLGVVTAEVITGANFLKDIAASFHDFFGGRTSSYENVLKESKNNALLELQMQANALGANAIVGISLDYENLGANGSLLMVSCSGTAVIV